MLLGFVWLGLLESVRLIILETDHGPRSDWTKSLHSSRSLHQSQLYYIPMWPFGRYSTGALSFKYPKTSSYSARISTTPTYISAIYKSQQISTHNILTLMCNPITIDMVRIPIRSWISCAPLNSHISIAYYELAYIIHAVCNMMHTSESFGIKSFFSAGVMVERRGAANELPEVGADHHLNFVSHKQRSRKGISTYETVVC